MNIIRGTTPSLFCSLPDNISFDSVSDIWISMTQYGDIVVDKRLSRDEIKIDQIGVIDGPSHLRASIKLTQKETLSFSVLKQVLCGVRVLLSDGTALASKEIYKFTVTDVVKEGVME